MITRRRGHRWGAFAPWGAALALACATAPARAGEPPAGDSAWRFSLGALSGSVVPDAALAGYQWAVLPRAAWGAQTLAGRGPFEGGLRL